MKQIKLTLCFCLGYLASTAQTTFSLANVPDALKNKAAIITHLETMNLEVEDLDEATLQVRKVFTVLNEEGKHALFFNQYTTKYLTLEEAEIKVYDQNGKQVEKFKKKDMTTVAVGEGLIEDGYLTYYQIPAASYPITVEFNYEQKFKSTLSFPDYRFISHKEAIVESNYTAKIPAEMTLRFKAKNNNLAPVITEEGKNKIYKWTVKNMAAIDDEEGSVDRGERLPYVGIVSEQFSHYGFRGDLSSWKSFGNWINELYKGLDELPAERRAFFQSLVKNAANEEEKIRLVYNYLQENFRYVSIQLGIGGLKPFSALFTDQKKYGDCKALSNYMKAALKTVGIKSHVAIINAAYNQEPVDPAFPANNFNHVILCIPGLRDSTWLECTSSTAEFGKLGTFTENRNALLITEEGGVLVPTPKSESATNTFFTRTVVDLQTDLSAITETIMTTSGEYREMMADVLKDKKDDQKKMVVYYLGYKQPDDFLLTAKADANEQTSLKMSVRKLSEFNSGNKHFLSPRVHKMWASKLPTAEGRKLDFYFRHPFEKRDTTIFKLTPGMQVDVLPAPKDLQNSYGSYQSKSWFNEKENAVYTATILVLKKHKVLAADYKTVRSFFEDVMQDDTQRVVIKQTDNAPPPKKAF